MSQRILWVLAAVLAAALPARADVLNRWIQAGPDGQALARALVTDAACPALAVDGTPRAMEVRFPPTPEFPVRLCEAQVTPGPRTATIAGVALKLPVAAPKRILVIGDTGCRIADGRYQACNDEAAFPLARLAMFAVPFDPDLIVHVGDYYYRETACPAGEPGCAGSPFGDRFDSWNADFFTPLAPLLAAAPFVATRGNHESCGRGARGWFRLLDPRPFDPKAADCQPRSDYDTTPIYAVPAGSATLLVQDSSLVGDRKVEPALVERYAADLGQALKRLTGPAIFVTHRPPYGLHDASGEAGARVLRGGNPTFQTLFRDGVPDPIKLLLSGHIHSFHYVDLGLRYAPQVVVGDSGTALDPATIPETTGDATYVGADLKAPILHSGDTVTFGFTVLDATAFGWTANVYDLTGRAYAQCVIRTADRSMACTH